MTKHKSNRDIGRGVKAVQHGQAQAIGPMLNVRHPKKYPPVMKKTAPSADDTESGKAEKVLTGSDSASNNT